MPTKPPITYHHAKPVASKDDEVTENGEETLHRVESSFDLSTAGAGSVKYRQAVADSEKKGGNGIVREFVPDTDEAQPRPHSVMVKKPKHPNASEAELRKAERELAFFHRVYPELPVHLVKGNPNAPSAGDYRLLMPKLGQTFTAYAQENIRDGLAFKSLVTAVLHELARIHQHNICHGDAVSQNILVLPGNKIHFIDAAQCSEKTDRGVEEDCLLVAAEIIVASRDLFARDIFPKLTALDDGDAPAPRNCEELLSLLAVDNEASLEVTRQEVSPRKPLARPK